MSKARWSDDDMKKAGLVQDPDGNYVPVKSLAAKGKVSKLPTLIERAGIAQEQIQTAKNKIRNEMSKLPPLNVKKVHGFEIIDKPMSDPLMAFGYAMMANVDPYQQEDEQNKATIVVKNIDDVAALYTEGKKIFDENILNELKNYAKYYGTKIMSEWSRVNIKPLTQNRAWKGRRFKSDQYKAYAIAVSLLLPANLIVPDGLLKVYYEFGMSTNSDFDNPCKMFTDILQSKYHFNDSKIMEAHIKKVIVKKGEEFIKFRIESL